MPCTTSLVHFHAYLLCVLATEPSWRSCVCGPVEAAISVEAPIISEFVNQGSDPTESSAHSGQVSLIGVQVGLRGTQSDFHDRSRATRNRVASNIERPSQPAFDTFSVEHDGVLEALLEAISDFHAEASTAVDGRQFAQISHTESVMYEYESRMQEYLDYVSAYGGDALNAGAASVSDLNGDITSSSPKRRRTDESPSSDPGLVDALSDPLRGPVNAASSADDAPGETTEPHKEITESYDETAESYDENAEIYDETVESHQETTESSDARVSEAAAGEPYAQGSVANGKRRREWSAYSPAEDAAICERVGLAHPSVPLEESEVRLHIGDVVRKRGVSGVRKRADHLLLVQGRYVRPDRRIRSPEYHWDEVSILHRWILNGGPTNEELDLLLDRHTFGSIEGKLERMRRKQ